MLSSVPPYTLLPMPIPILLRLVPFPMLLLLLQTETHFVIFVHGFQGNSADLCLVKGHLSLIYPYLECYSSRVNEVRAGRERGRGEEGCGVRVWLRQQQGQRSEGGEEREAGERMCGV